MAVRLITYCGLLAAIDWSDKIGDKSSAFTTNRYRCDWKMRLKRSRKSWWRRRKLENIKRNHNSGSDRKTSPHCKLKKVESQLLVFLKSVGWKKVFWDVFPSNGLRLPGKPWIPGMNSPRIHWPEQCLPNSANIVNLIRVVLADTYYRQVIGDVSKWLSSPDEAFNEKPGEA